MLVMGPDTVVLRSTTDGNADVRIVPYPNMDGSIAAIVAFDVHTWLLYFQLYLLITIITANSDEQNTILKPISNNILGINGNLDIFTRKNHYPYQKEQNLHPHT